MYHGFEYFGSDNPYVLDYLVGKYHGREYKIPALTKKNRNFIEGVVKLDSNYGIDDDPESNPDRDFFLNRLEDKELEIKAIKRDPELMGEISSSGKYCGSTAYWFDQMKKGSSGYKKCLLGSIISIDRVNSTHLESSIVGRFKMFEVITSIAPGIDELKDALKNTSINATHLIGKMSAEIEARRKDQTRSNISFATKFCSYAAYYLFKDDKENKVEYSKYDQVVSHALNLYVLAYTEESFPRAHFQISSDRRRRMQGSEERLDYTLSVYNEYATRIGKILEKDNEDISRNEFDHIVWYGLKSR